MTHAVDSSCTREGDGFAGGDAHGDEQGVESTGILLILVKLRFKYREQDTEMILTGGTYLLLPWIRRK